MCVMAVYYLFVRPFKWSEPAEASLRLYNETGLACPAPGCYFIDYIWIYFYIIDSGHPYTCGSRATRFSHVTLEQLHCSIDNVEMLSYSQFRRFERCVRYARIRANDRNKC